MTLILGAVARNYAFHVSDRLITKTSVKDETTAWDIASNKTVIVVGSDCWLVLGYTGLAYLDGKPTDQFIAEAISGNEEMVGMGGWYQPADQLHYRAITSRVEAAMESAYSRLSIQARKFSTTLLGVGLQANSSGRGLRHVMFESRVSRTGIDHMELGNRRQGSHSFGFHGVGSVDPHLHRICRESIKSQGDQSPEHVTSAMVDAVRATGKSSKFVGEVAMAVTLVPPL